ncbi:Cell division protein FtsL [Paenibacillus uliginis N3/975]|uniref:Cell division protein FtsL n=1 Tax=Paenibacillus uliginis N3/975 TaxID=1313296 RepID=A0A1X7HKK4_9BACL|nr:cell division protein FtsL [Paenibacillus uliginis]SMF88410.1 Cell division protein FtsL [Paenibacillus uliginis N3/975]
MAYTRGNLAVQERQKQQPQKQQPSQYLEKTTVIKRRSQLPKREKLLYLMSVLFVVTVTGWVGMSHVKVYDLNRQIQNADSDIHKLNKSMDTLQVKKQTLEMGIAQKAKELGYVQVEQGDAIHVPATSGKSDTSSAPSGQN